MARVMCEVMMGVNYQRSGGGFAAWYTSTATQGALRSGRVTRGPTIGVRGTASTWGSEADGEQE